MASADDPWRVVKTSETTFEILEAIAAAGEASASAVADRVGMARSTAHDHLKTLDRLGFVVKDGADYRLSLKFLQYGATARNQVLPSEAIQSSIDRLARDTGETAWFNVEERGRLVHVNRSMGDRALTLGDDVGNHHSLHYYAAGKAILAHLPESRVRAILDDAGLDAWTDHTLTDEDALFEELATVRETGVAYNDGEFNEGTRAVAAPVLVEDRVVGAVALHGPTNRFRGAYFREELTREVEACANEIELKLVQRSSQDLFE